MFQNYYEEGLVQPVNTSRAGKEWCFGKPLTWDTTEWKYLCGVFFSQIQIFKWLRQQQDSERDKFWDDSEIRGSDWGQVFVRVALSPVIFWRFQMDWLPPLTPHILTGRESPSPPLFPHFCLLWFKDCQTGSWPLAPPLAELISQISRYLVLPIILNHCFKLGDPCSEDRKIVPVIFHAASQRCCAGDGKTEKLIN